MIWIILYIISTVISLIVFNESVYNHIKNREGEASDSAKFHIAATGLAFFPVFNSLILITALLKKICYIEEPIVKEPFESDASASDYIFAPPRIWTGEIKEQKAEEAEKVSDPPIVRKKPIIKVTRKPTPVLDRSEILDL